MEKKLETTSHDDEVDRISEFPEHIIHHIMEFLPIDTADVTRMSVLSKKFFSFWCSLPVLDFNTETILNKSKASLWLEGFNLEAQHLTLSLPLIENFNLCNCSGITSITLRGEVLGSACFIDCYGLEKIQVDGQTRNDDLTYGGKSYCDINVASTKSVKLIIIEDTHIYGKWFHSNFCRFVEELDFVLCSFPVKTRWCFHQLKRLQLYDCPCKVEFETPNLERFYYSGNLEWDIPLIISSRRFDAKLQVDDLNVNPIFRPFSIARLSDIIRFIAQCQTLTLQCDSA
ncbi:hypothetical protein FNV43_RR09054 [Rhamnella rubrinervis]|uniref:F-box domain-containing protein n=1 Tax=Rhamnella rubrinervis TaxID=2594499 RepID=A0A8K0MJH3_9ROSA|nr:hypothetical protein FNV43_RR09054 [Rhamnella rubrinervis]